MPRYFFNVHDGQDLPDTEGTDYPTPRAARADAVIAAGEMLQDLEDRFWQGGKWRMHVTDEQGATVCLLRVNGKLGKA